MAISSTIPSLLTERTGAVAIASVDGLSWSFGEVAGLCVGLAGQLRAAGVGRQDRIAIATSNGPVAALAFLAATTAAVAAPLNPAYRRAEFEFALRDLPARVLLTDGSAPEAVEAAQALGIPKFTISSSFSIEGQSPGPFVDDALPGDVALVLHTSGTTGSPKRVPLTHANLIASAANIADSLALTPADRCLNVMPLFHIHGLVGCVLASLYAGATVVCTPGFDAFKFTGWLANTRATWFSAVPTMHQAILSRQRGQPDGATGDALRFVRSASSALPLSVIASLETTFGVPVIEAYGMTEAAHQVATNPLPPGERRAGSVGQPSRVEVAVFDPDGRRVTVGSRGEVAIRGASVTSGYEGIDPGTTTFSGGWLRTGDEGYRDPDGYLWLTGRLKEQINRGGEKVSPSEVEDVLLAHPAVRAAIVFAIPHQTLGQDVAAAVVPSSEESPIDAASLRAFAAERLSRYKVPRTIVTVEAIPLGPTGKPQRTGMAERLGLV